MTKRRAGVKGEGAREGCARRERLRALGGLFHGLSKSIWRRTCGSAGLGWRVSCIGKKRRRKSPVWWWLEVMCAGVRALRVQAREFAPCIDRDMVIVDDHGRSRL